MSCKKFRSEIEEAARGATLGADAEAHVAACASCRALCAERERLIDLIGDLARVEAPADFEFRLRARIARAEGGTRAPVWRRAFVPDAAWLAVAGCLVLALGVFVHFRAGAAREQGGGAQGATVARIDSQGATNVRDEHIAASSSSESNAQTLSAREPKVVETKGRSLATLRHPNAARRGRLVLPREAVEEIARVVPAQPRSESRSMAVTGAKIYTATPIPLPGASPDRKLEALFNDAHGAKRVVAVDPFAFGARGQTREASVKNVSYTGVW